MQQEYKHAEITQRIINGYYAVYNTLGYGFLERVYVNALMLELRRLASRQFKRLASMFTTTVKQWVSILQISS
jgi:GxxExxY protein